MINTTPGEAGLNFKYWSPMSVGVWALLIFGFFAFVSFLETLWLDRREPATPAEWPSMASRIFAAIGCIFALFIASYTGVLLSVSNQPIWSDTWTLGALFLASALSGSAAMLSWLSAYRSDAAPETEVRLRTADGYFALLELIAIVLLFITIAGAGQLSRALAAPWLILWILVLASLVPPLMGLTGRRAWLAPGDGTVAVATAAQYTARSALVVLIGVLLMRAVIIFSAQV
ncbi:MAG: NrfD/PsrC family molybdoenzyme membrane anchor subunit, partial [Vulcanimicrobiaceae bacterium]